MFIGRQPLPSSFWWRPVFIVSHRGLIRFVSILDDGFSQPALPRRQTTAELLSSLRRTTPIVTLQHWKESLTRRIYNQHQTRKQELPPGNVWTRCSPSRTPIDATVLFFQCRSVYRFGSCATFFVTTPQTILDPRVPLDVENVNG